MNSTSVLTFVIIITIIGLFAFGQTHMNIFEIYSLYALTVVFILYISNNRVTTNIDFIDNLKQRFISIPFVESLSNEIHKHYILILTTFSISNIIVYFTIYQIL